MKDSKYDYRPTFEVLLNFEKEGWKLNSHSFGIATPDESRDSRIIQYLMSRINNNN